jgi:hypothetical protein
MLLLDPNSPNHHSIGMHHHHHPGSEHSGLESLGVHLLLLLLLLC